MAEAFTANFTESVGADTITFDGETTTLAGGKTPADIATAIALTAYKSWITTNIAGVVTFSRRDSGELPDIVAGNFDIVGAGVRITPGVKVETTTQGAAASGGALGTQNVTTHTIDVYNAQQNGNETSLFISMAQQGGGRYFLNLINGSGAIGVDGACGGEIRGTFTGVGLPTDPVAVNLPGEDPILIGSVSKTNTNTCCREIILELVFPARAGIQSSTTGHRPAPVRRKQVYLLP